MTRMIRTVFIPLLLLFALSSCNTLRKSTEEKMADEEVATFILVRHAEKEYGDKPGLTKVGLERAERLSFILKNTDLDAVYSTPTKRTRLTATPTAEAHELPVIPYDATLLKEFSKDLKRLYKGKTALIVGHSNTTPAMANFLANTDENPRFSELDYTNLYVITVPRIGKARVLKLRY